MITLLFFGNLAETLGQSQYQIELKQPSPVIELYSNFMRDYPMFQKTSHLMFAVNEEQVGANHIVNDGDEVAFMPPFAGG